MRSVLSETPSASSHSTRRCVMACIASVDGTRPLRAAIATVLSVKEYTCRLSRQSDCSATSPIVEAASSRSQISSCLSSSLHCPSTKSSSSPATAQAP
jgi:hypothetical protein